MGESPSKGRPRRYRLDKPAPREAYFNLPAATYRLSTLMDSPEHKKRDIVRYMSIEAPDEQIVRLERVASQRVITDRYDVWDVHTDKGRWWVITPMTNLYTQADFPSMDYALTFHVGLMQRMAARNEPDVTDEQRDRVTSTWRKWTQAADALDHAEEAEDFQAVGVRLRECLISLVRELSDDSYVPSGVTPPKGADVPGWLNLIAAAIAAGDGASRIRGFLKVTGKETWDLVQWLTHASKATRNDALIALNACQQATTCFLLAAIKFERGVPDRCPSCSSYRLVSDYRPERGMESPYVTLCESCGWESPG